VTQTTIYLDDEDPKVTSLQVEATTRQQVDDLIAWGYGKNLTEIVRHAIREAWERWREIGN
jgi:Arc/MetJ-type ribon-helix-helix transcriptional regulator